MKHFIAFAAVVISFTLFLSAGCNNQSSDQKPDQGQTEEQELTEEQEVIEEQPFESKTGKGKMEQIEEVPPAPGDEEIAPSPELKEEPVQKQTQKQSQKN